MRQLGLKKNLLAVGSRQVAILAVGLALGCKAAPEPAPAEASAPKPPEPAAAPEAPTRATPSPETPPGAPAPAPVASASAEQPMSAASKTYTESTKSISAKVGERFSVAVPSNITIPMKWRLEPVPDGKVLSLTDEKHFDQPPAGCADCVGYGGTRIFSFEAKAAGKHTLKFALRPLTDPKGTAQKEVGIDVVIGG